jgi:hypothetical protein
MHVFAAAGAAFLSAVLWFDLMFDVQVRGFSAGAVPPDALRSISNYYRRVTTEARPMNLVVSFAMLATVLALVGEIFEARNPLELSLGCLVLAVSAVGLALARTVRNARTLGQEMGAIEHRSVLAHKVYGDHVYCLSAIVVVLGLQLLAR